MCICLIFYEVEHLFVCLSVMSIGKRLLHDFQVLHNSKRYGDVAAYPGKLYHVEHCVVSSVAKSNAFSISRTVLKREKLSSRPAV